jgi:hypothetical protein
MASVVQELGIFPGHKIQNISDHKTDDSSNQEGNILEKPKPEHMPPELAKEDPPLT